MRHFSKNEKQNPYIFLCGCEKSLTPRIKLIFYGWRLTILSVKFHVRLSHSCH